MGNESLIENSGVEDARALFDMGEKYENIFGNTHDFTKAFELFKRIAEQGYGDAQAKVGLYYLMGRGELIRTIKRRCDGFILAKPTKIQKRLHF